MRLAKAMIAMMAALLAMPGAGAGATPDRNLQRATALSRQVVELAQAGRQVDAIPLAVEVLAIRETVLGLQHPEVARSLNSLAALYADENRIADAEPLYQRSLAILDRRHGRHRLDVAATLNGLAGLYRAQGRYADAEPLYRRSLAIREKALGPRHPDVADSLTDLAQLFADQHRYADAERLTKRGLAIREKHFGAAHPSVADSRDKLAALDRAQPRPADADALDKRGAAVRDKPPAPERQQTADSLNTLAAQYREQRRYDDAEALYKRSLAMVETTRGADHVDVAASLDNLAALYRDQNRYADAAPLQQRSLAIREKALGPEHPTVVGAVDNLARLYGKLGRYAEAETLYKRSLATNEKQLGPDHPEIVANLDNLAGLYGAAKRTAEAAALSRRAVAILGRRVAEDADERANGGVVEPRRARHAFVHNVALVRAVDDGTASAETFRIAQLAHASGAVRTVPAVAARVAAGTDALAAAVRERQDVAERWQRLDAALLEAASKPPAARDAVAEARLRAELAAAAQRLDGLDARVAREFPQYAELRQPRPVDLRTVRALLAPDEALLVYLSSPQETWLWAVRRDRVALHRIELDAKGLTAEVMALRRRLDPALNPDRKPFDAQRAHALYQKLVAPAKSVIEEARQIFVVPDGALESLPLGVLVTAAPKQNPETPADHRTVAWLARDQAIAVLPAVSSLQALRRSSAAERAAAPFLGIGDPVLEGAPGAAREVRVASLFRGALADVAAVRKLAPLPDSAAELRALAKALGTGDQSLYLAERASEPLLRTAGLDNYRMLAFATWGLTSGALGGRAEPALVLTPPREASADNDGLLTASEIATLKLNADWVLLSGSRTTAADGTPDADGLSALAKAFFYAGARSLLVSHWAVESGRNVACAGCTLLSFFAPFLAFLCAFAFMFWFR
ncbi:MAG: CHAT domain-containing protein, partial [Proteobacteria bacterium]|nr:CHAT domain-containing protein [Pseudomonadota bacterium]